MEGKQVFSDWTVRECIGKGAFGKVYRITREDFGEEYEAALKVIEIPQEQTEVDAVRREGMDENSVTDYFKDLVKDLVKEFSLMSKLKGNSNIVSYEDHSVVPKEGGFGWTIYIRMELLKPFYTYIQEHNLTVRDIIKLGMDICSALEICQKYNIIHRDIKPENMFVSEVGDFKLGDFGIARQLEKTSTGLSKKGTFTYMAPEVYKGLAYNSTVDIYSLGIVLYRFLNNNRSPFLPAAPAPIRFADREKANVLRMSGEPIPAPCNAKGRLAEIVLKACAYDPKERYESAYELRQALQTVLYSEGEGKEIYPQGDQLENESVDYISDRDTEKKDIIESNNDGEGTVLIFQNNQEGDGKDDRQDREKTEKLGTDFVDNIIQEDKQEEPTGDETVLIFEKDKKEASEGTPAHEEKTERLKEDIIKKEEQQAGQESPETGNNDDQKERPGKKKRWGLVAAAGIAVCVIAGMGIFQKGASRNIENEVKKQSEDVTAQQEDIAVEKNNEETEEPDVQELSQEDLEAYREKGFYIDYRVLEEYNGDAHEVIIPTGVTQIGQEAFYECTELTSIVLPSGITSIGNSAFYGCTGLTSIKLPTGITSIGNEAFCDCTELTSIELPTGITSIGDYAFGNCTGLTSIELPSGITSIGNSAFYGCTGLTSIELPTGITSIGGWAFCNCTELTSIELPTGITSIGDYAFGDCTGLTSIELPTGITSIGDGAFSGCTGLTSIELPTGITGIDANVFSGCTGLTSIELPSGITSIGYNAFSETGLTSIELPSGITRIDNDTFYGCTGLTNIELPSGITSIGYRAFMDCTGLTSIELPSGITSIGKKAFPKKVTLYCHKGSYALKYAKKHNFSYKIVKE